MKPIYHITQRTTWEQALPTGFYRADSLESQGFIHCSTAEQVEGVANRIYRGASGLVLLEVDPSRTGAEIRTENLEGGMEKFPHIYGPLPAGAVVRVLDFPAEADGSFTLPVEVLNLE